MKSETHTNNGAGSDCQERIVLPLPGFTPGPWSADIGDPYATIYEKDEPFRLICDFQDTEDPERRDANARAIAAVPLMFAALERLERTCNAVHEVSGGTPQHQAMWLAQLEARDAISEVTGIPWQNDEHVHHYQRERASITGLGL